MTIFSSGMTRGRRLRYAIWILLLVLSLIALIMWETPKNSGVAELRVSLRPVRFPIGCKAQAWVGPRNQWKGETWDGRDAWAELAVNTEEMSFPAVALPVGYRRWVKDYIPRRTADLLVVKFIVVNESPRYFVLPLGADWSKGSFRMNRHTGIRAEISWDTLWQDPSEFKEMR